MSGKHHTDHEASHLYRSAVQLLMSGMTIPQVCEELKVSPATFHRWRRKFEVPGRTKARKGKTGDRPGRLHRLELENKRLKVLVAELLLENAFLKDDIENGD